MEQRLSLVTLGVADLGRAVRFYEALGWRRSNADEGVAFFQGPGMVIALWSRDQLAEDAGVSSEGSGFRGIALAHNTRDRAEVDAVLAEAAAAGASSRSRRPRRPGAATPDTSPTRTAISGRWRTIRSGPSDRMAASSLAPQAVDNAASAAVAPRRAEG